MHNVIRDCSKPIRVTYKCCFLRNEMNKCMQTAWNTLLNMVSFVCTD